MGVSHKNHIPGVGGNFSGYSNLLERVNEEIPGSTSETLLEHNGPEAQLHVPNIRALSLA